LKKQHQLYRPTIPVPLDEYLWLKWFAENADFGPADSDVKIEYQEQYEQETGNTVPEDWRIDNDDD